MAQDPLSHVASWLKPDASAVATTSTVVGGRELTEDEKVELRLLETFDRMKPRRRQGPPREISPSTNLVDPLPAMLAERDRLWEEVGSGDPGDADKMLRADLIEEQIIGMVASSASGIVAQLRLAKELTEINMLDGRDDREERLNATIIAGVERLAGCASLTTVAPTSTAADDTDPVLALIAEEKRLEALWTAADEISFEQGEAIGKSREVKAIGEQMVAILDQILNTKPVTIGGAIAMLERGLAGGCIDERLTNAAIAGLRDLQLTGELVAVKPPHDDSRILALFREWVAAERFAARSGPDENAVAAAVDKAVDIVNEIIRAPATGAVGLAIKAYVTLYWETASDIDDAAKIGRDWADHVGQGVSAHVKCSLIADAVRFAPELAPLAVHVVSNYERAFNPEIIGFGEPEKGGAAMSAEITPFAVERRFTPSELRMIEVFRRGNPNLTADVFADYENGTPEQRYLYSLFRRAFPPAPTTEEQS